MFKKILLFMGGALFGAYTAICTIITVTSLNAFCSTKTISETSETETKS